MSFYPLQVLLQSQQVGDTPVHVFLLTAYYFLKSLLIFVAPAATRLLCELPHLG